MRTAVCAPILVVVLAAASARAQDRATGESQRRPAPIPEPILTESITDLDAVEAGETEFALNGQILHAARGGARAWQASVEAEWRATSHLGLRLEPSYANLEEEGRSREFGLQVAAAWGLFHDFENDFHVQVEATGRLTGNEKPFESQPGDSALPYSAGVRVGKRFGSWTIRPGAGAEVGATPAHAPLWLGIGVLYQLGEAGRYGFVGMELDADAGRDTPFIVAPNFMVDMKPVGFPFRLGFAVPYVVGADKREPSLGFYLRLLVRTEMD